jgi:hypothetical protein
VDTNVLAVSNFRAEHAAPSCVAACVAMLVEIRERHTVVIDDGTALFTEYFRHAARRGQPGVGDAFVKWLWDHQGILERCERVRITPLPGGPDEYEEFPCDPDLHAFDRSDRKFVAVALSSRLGPEVLNALDSDWSLFLSALQRNGVTVRFLCPAQVGPPVA